MHHLHIRSRLRLVHTLPIQMDTIDLVIPRSAIPGNTWKFMLMARTAGGEDRMPDSFSAGYSDGTFSATFDSFGSDIRL